MISDAFACHFGQGASTKSRWPMMFFDPVGYGVRAAYSTPNKTDPAGMKVSKESQDRMRGGLAQQLRNTGSGA